MYIFPPYVILNSTFNSRQSKLISAQNISGRIKSVNAINFPSTNNLIHQNITKPIFPFSRKKWIRQTGAPRFILDGDVVISGSVQSNNSHFLNFNDQIFSNEYCNIPLVHRKKNGFSLLNNLRPRQRNLLLIHIKQLSNFQSSRIVMNLYLEHRIC